MCNYLQDLTQDGINKAKQAVCGFLSTCLEGSFTARATLADYETLRQEAAVGPVGFPRETTFSMRLSLDGEVVSVVKIAYSAEKTSLFSKEEFYPDGINQSVTRKRYLSHGQLGCGYTWNVTDCQGAFTEDQGFASNESLPLQPHDFILYRVLNLTSPLVLDSGSGNFVAQPGQSPPGVQLLYSEDSSGPRYLSLKDESGHVTLIQFSNVTATIDESDSDWVLPSSCPTLNGSRCAMECDGYGWGACPNSTYGIVIGPGAKYSECAAKLSLNTSSVCPSAAPFCMNTSVGIGPCSNVPYICADTAKPYLCGPGYPCCLYASNECHSGPCSAAYPAAMESPHVHQLPPTPNPTPPPTPPPSAINCSVFVDNGDWAQGAIITGTFTVSPGANDEDWLGLYQVGEVPGVQTSTWWQYLTSGATGGKFSTSNASQSAAWSMPCTGGPYVLYYLLSGGHAIAAQSSPFKIESRTATVSVDQASWGVGSFISGSYSVSPGTSCSDWVGLYRVGEVPGVQKSTWWLYVTSGATGGTFSTSNSSQSAAWSMPSTGGPYIVYFLLNGDVRPQDTIAAQSSPFDATTGTGS
jgi:hypothetical protein